MAGFDPSIEDRIRIEKDSDEAASAAPGSRQPRRRSVFRVASYSWTAAWIVLHVAVAAPWMPAPGDDGGPLTRLYNARAYAARVTGTLPQSCFGRDDLASDPGPPRPTASAPLIVQFSRRRPGRTRTVQMAGRRLEPRPDLDAAPVAGRRSNPEGMPVRLPVRLVEQPRDVARRRETAEGARRRIHPSGALAGVARGLAAEVLAHRIRPGTAAHARLSGNDLWDQHCTARGQGHLRGGRRSVPTDGELRPGDRRARHGLRHDGLRPGARRHFGIPVASVRERASRGRARRGPRW